MGGSRLVSGSKRAVGGQAMIILLLMVAVVGMLFGLGRLRRYRNQCARRIERQAALERVMATRSAMRLLSRYDTVPANGVTLPYLGQGGRRIDVSIVPVPPIAMLDFTNGWMATGEYAVSNAIPFSSTTSQVPPEIVGSEMRVVFPSNAVGRRAGIGIDFGDTWYSETFGLRYWYSPGMVNARTVPPREGDITRLYLVGTSGRGLTPTAQDFDNASVIVLEQTINTSSGSTENASVSLYCRRAGAAREELITGCQMNCAQAKGIQLAGDRATLFEKPETGLWTPSATVVLPEWVRGDFPDVRLCLEVESHWSQGGENRMISMQVHPAYRYELGLRWRPRGGAPPREEIATVVEIRGGVEDDYGYMFDTISYDTHGTYGKW